MADTREFAPGSMLIAADYALVAALAVATLWAALRDRDLLFAAFLFAIAGAYAYKQLRLTRQPYVAIDGDGITLLRRNGARYAWDTVRAVYPGRMSLQLQVAHGPLVSVSLLGVRSSERDEFVRLVESRAAAAYRG